jgi:arginyl-tRNA--protein-N-Asp/Glu arginylyltransferase
MQQQNILICNFKKSNFSKLPLKKTFWVKKSPFWHKMAKSLAINVKTCQIIYNRISFYNRRVLHSKYFACTSVLKRLRDFVLNRKLRRFVNKPRTTRTCRLRHRPQNRRVRQLGQFSSAEFYWIKLLLSSSSGCVHRIHLKRCNC